MFNTGQNNVVFRLHNHNSQLDFGAILPSEIIAVEEKTFFFFSFGIDDRNNFDRSQFYSSNTTSIVTEKSIEKQRGQKHVYKIQNIHQRVKTLYN